MVWYDLRVKIIIEKRDVVYILYMEKKFDEIIVILFSYKMVWLYMLNFANGFILNKFYFIIPMNDNNQELLQTKFMTIFR